MSFGDADLAYMLGEDFGVTVSITAGSVTTSTVGIYDEQWQAVLEGQAIAESARQKTVVLATGSLSFAQGDTLTVGGTPYTVVDLLPEGPDGRLTRVLLAG